MNRVLKAASVVFVIITVVAGFSYAETIWEKRQKAMQQNTGETKTEAPELKQETVTTSEAVDGIDLYSIVIPREYGTIIESYKGTNGKLIVHVQDAHMNYEAQKNSADILASLIENYGFNLVLLEGKVGEGDFSYVRERAPLDERIEKADRLLKSGDINGVNYLNIASDYAMNIRGIEDKAVYESQRSALWEMDKFKDAALEYTDKMMYAIAALKPKIYNEALSGIDKAKNDYDNETIDLVAYYENLYKAASNKNVQFDKFPNFNNVAKINELDKKIDLAGINDGTASEEQKALYEEYKSMLANLNVNKLFKEELLVENAIYEALFENSDQKKLYGISKAVSILDKMLRVKLVPEEYEYFVGNKADFNPEDWADFLREKSTALGVALNVPGNYYAINDNLSAVENFYSTAFKRDKVFVKRAEEHMKNANVDLSVLIAGGFHTPALTRLLADAGYSYIVISPRVTTKTDDNLYRLALKREWLPEVK